MGRSRGPKFSFPMPGRRSQATGKDDTATSLSAPRPIVPQWPSHLEEPTSKAHRVLGTSESPMFHSSSSSRHAPATPASSALGNTNSGTARQDSDDTSVNYRLQPQTSNSTMRSHYDAKTSPLSISQQTSNSAVRDMALRRGKPQVVTHGHGYSYDAREASPLSPMIDARNNETRKGKPARLDLSKLFPKPKGGDGQSYSNPLLSPA